MRFSRDPSKRGMIQIWFSSAAAGALLGLVAVGASGVAPDPRVESCGLNGEVEVAFDIPSAKTIWEYLPAMQRAPELESDDAPASVVVYRGAITAPAFGRFGMQPRDAHNVVCVLSNGQRTVYENVSRAGFTP
jgi:hypothetical protein